MLNKVCVVTVKVDNMNKAIEFYTKVLDFEISQHYGEEIVSLVHNEIPIVLEKTEKENLSSGQHVVLGVLSEDIKKDFDDLKSKGVKMVFDEPKPCPPGYYFVIEDPAGNQVEILEFSNE